jgi:catecholate siderophore receptor
VLSGEQRVRGWEVGISGRVVQDWAWDLFANYSYLDGEVRESKTLACTANQPACIEGAELARTPRHSASFWSSFKPFGERWTIGGGATYVSHRFSNASQTPNKVDGYLRWDGMISYQLSEQVSVQLNLQNIGDEEYFQEVGGGHAVPAPGRSFVLTTSFQF